RQLPASKRARPGHGNPLPPSPTQRGAIRMSQDIRVFVVEDQPQILDSLVRILAASEGVEVCGQARSGEEALESIPAADPGVILCDLGLPGMDGIELTRALKARRPEVEILVF